MSFTEAPMGVLATTLLFAACSTPAAASGAADSARTWRFSTGPTASVEIQNVSGRVTVKAAPGSEVSVETVTHGGTEADRARWVVEAQATGSAVRVRARCGEDGQGCHSRAAVDMTIAAPPASRLTVRGVSTDLSVAGLTGGLQAESTSGDVQIAGAGPVSVRTVSGDVHLDGAASVTIQSVSGDLTLRGIQGGGQLRTVSGDVGWDGTCAAGCRLTAQTVSGDLHLRLAHASSFDLDYRTHSGDLTDHLGATTRAERRGAHARVGNGEGKISLQTVSGDLDLEPGP
jgi:hypothetical protein